MLKKVAFTMFEVKDAARARAFYGETLGLALGSHSADGVWTEYDLPGGGCLALYGTDKARPSAGASIAFEVDDLDALSAELKTKGVAFRGDLVHSPVCRMAFIADPDGNSICLHQLKPR